MARKEYHFDFSSTDSQPKKEKEQIPLWCDYLEMLCLMEYRGFISRSVVMESVFEGGNDILSPDGDSDDENDFEGEDLEVLPDLDLVAQLANLGSSNSRYTDNQERLVNDWFNHLASRNESLGESYPFEANSLRGTLKAKRSFTPAHNLYLCLLLASNLHLFSAKLRTKLTSDFEQICFETQKLLFPLSLQGASIETHLFGKNSLGTSRFTGTLADKVNTLATLIKARQVDTSFLSNSNSGDGGIDLISVINFNDDKAFGVPLILSQCACSYKDWKKKQYDHSASRYRQMRLFDVDYFRLVFIPFFYRDQNGQWFNIGEIEISVIDRLRIMKILLNQSKILYSQAELWASLASLTDRNDRRLFAEFIADDRAA